MEKLTERQKETLKFLSKKEWKSPTQVGHLFGGHSSIGSPICKKLVEKGLAVRSEKGWYKRV